MTPPSVRFLGRKVYLGAVVVLVSAMRQGLTPRRVRELSNLFGADRRTIARWQVFWREQIPRSARPRPAENSLNGYCQAQAVVAYTNASAVLNAKLSDKFFKRGSNLNGYLKPHFWIVLILNAYSESLFV